MYSKNFKLFYNLKKYSIILENQKLNFSSDIFTKIPQYKSSLNIEKIYSKNIQLINKKQDEPKNDDKFSGYIPIEKLQMTFCRSSGPGGQNLNKVNSKVTVSFRLDEADWIPKKTIEKLKIIHKNNLTINGLWLIRSDKTRFQTLNIADCLDKLRCYISEAEQPPRLPSIEILEKKKEAIEKASAKRLREKRHKSMLLKMKNFNI